MAKQFKGPLSEMEKMAKKIGTDGEDIVKELEAMDTAALNKRIAQANQAIAETKAQLDANVKYAQAKEAVKDLSSGFRDVKKRQNAIISVAVQLRKDRGEA
jgi:septation ring formation regulator EzrA